VIHQRGEDAVAGRLEGQVAIVTGAGRGFGEAIALGLAAEGAGVALVSRSAGELERVARQIESAGGRAVVAAGDVTARETAERAVALAESRLGPLTLVVNNAGVPGPFGPFWECDPDEWWEAQAVHLRAPFLFMHAALPGMIARGAGRLVTVSAIGGYLVAPNLSAYCTGKASQIRLTALAAAELRPHGISVFAIDPGFVFTRLAAETMNSPAAQKHLPGMVERLAAKEHDPAAQRDLPRCAERVVGLASGRYDALSGSYCELGDDLDAWLADPRSHLIQGRKP
jgi:NAD(P)-dependent dehydrogenase (short-subunit alcohol dehydrogenase family)